MDPAINNSLMPEIWPLVLKTGGALVVILLIIFAMLMLAKKFTALPGLTDEIKIIGARHLSPKEKLILVEVLGTKILLGITPGKIDKIETFRPTGDVVDVSFSRELEQKMAGKKEGQK